MDLVQELERAIPAGPPLPPPEARAATGRRALRRRRALQGLAAAGAVAALVVPVALVSGGPATRGHDPAPPVTQPSEGRASEPAAPGRERRPAREHDPAATYPWGPGEVAAAVPGDGLLLRPGATVLERRADLYPGKDTESVALRLRFRGLEHWAALEWDEGGSSGAIGSPRDPFYGDFEDFVVKATSGGGMTHGPPPGSRGPDRGAPRPVDVAGLRWDGERIVVDGPGRVLERRGYVDLTDAFAGPDDPTGAALVELPDATRVLVLYRESGGEGQLIAVTADGEGRTLADQLAWARGRYRSGAGLL